jgi:hypothetical protein
VKSLYNITGKLLIIVVLFLFLIGLGRRIGRYECETSYVAMIDSLNIIANQKPDTIILYDTIYPDPIIKWLPREKDSIGHIHIPPDLNFYSDSVVNNEVTIYIQDTVRGTI